MGGVDLAGLLSNPGFMTMVRKDFLSATFCMLFSDWPKLTHMTSLFLQASSLMNNPQVQQL